MIWRASQDVFDNTLSLFKHAVSPLLPPPQSMLYNINPAVFSIDILDPVSKNVT